MHRFAMHEWNGGQSPPIYIITQATKPFGEVGLPTQLCISAEDIDEDQLCKWFDEISLDSYSQFFVEDLRELPKGLRHYLLGDGPLRGVSPLHQPTIALRCTVFNEGHPLRGLHCEG